MVAVSVADYDIIEYEFDECADDATYFVNHYCNIYDAVVGAWIPFALWPAQEEALTIIQGSRQVVVLKARQIGMTWLCIAHALWLMIFHPAATVLLFSRRDEDAIELLDGRLKGMYERLTKWMQAAAVTADSKHEFGLSNGSRAKAFPATAGDSYTATLVVLDEFDIVQDQGALLRSVKPTIATGGQMVMLSRADKNRPQTQFKKTFKAAQSGANDFTPVFLPWYIHPGRDAEWYEAQRRDIQTRTGSEDELYEQYPATVQQALAANYAALVYPTFSETENVTEEAEYNPAWPIHWGVDDGLTYGQGPGHYDYHPRVILLFQITNVGKIIVFAEYWECNEPDFNKTIDDVLAWGYPQPELACVDSSATTFRGMLSKRSISTIGATHKVSEGIKNLRGLMCDANGIRLLLIHPRCENLIREMAAYKYDEKSIQSQSGERKPLKLDDHGPDALRYGVWRLRYN